MLSAIGKALRLGLLVLFYVSGALLLLRAVQIIRHRQLTYPFVLALSALGGFIAYVLINAVVHVTSFPLTAVSTFSPIYPLLLIFMTAVWWDAATAWIVFRSDLEPSP